MGKRKHGGPFCQTPYSLLLPLPTNTFHFLTLASFFFSLFIYLLFSIDTIISVFLYFPSSTSNYQAFELYCLGLNIDNLSVIMYYSFRPIDHLWRVQNARNPTKLTDNVVENDWETNSPNG